MAQRILILVGGHLSTAPRAQKEALALGEAGYEVEVGGVWFDRERIVQDLEMMARTGIRFTPALDFSGGGTAGELRRIRVRMRARQARWRFAHLAASSPELLGYGARELLARARERSADLTIVHSEAGLWAGAGLLHQGRRVGVDFEDWFSRDLSAEARRERPVAMLEHLERTVAKQAKYVLAPSHAMAGALSQTYGIPEPTVIYNVFPKMEPAPKADVDSEGRFPSLHWFSQTIGPDRGLELLFAALPLLKNRVGVCLRGECSEKTRKWLTRMIPASWRERVIIRPLVPSHELPACIAEHDIGLALELSSIPSRDLSVSNKLFQYLQAGLAVIATPTQGQREVLAQCGEAGALIPVETPDALAQSINRYLSDPLLLTRAKDAARQAAAKIFSWEVEKERLTRAAARALAD